MNRKPSPTAIGAFVMGAIVLAIAGVLTFGSGKFLERTTKVVMYFEESVAGLDIGAPVDFNGVRVGRVADMKLVYDDVTGVFLIPVYAELTEGVVHAENRGWLEETDGGKLVEMGLRAKLESSSFVTGKLKIALSFVPTSEPRLVGWDRTVQEIPTIPGMMESLIRTLQSLPLTNIVNDAHRAVRGIADIVEDPGTREAVAALREAGGSLASLVAKLDKEVDPTSKQFRDTLQAVQDVASTLEGNVSVITESFREAAAATAASLETASEAMTRLQKSVDPASPLRYEILKMIQELRDTARMLRTFLDTLERDPSSLIGGKSNQ